jgi:hypothetical protein
MASPEREGTIFVGKGEHCRSYGDPSRGGIGQIDRQQDSGHDRQGGRARATRRRAATLRNPAAVTRRPVALNHIEPIRQLIG